MIDIDHQDEVDRICGKVRIFNRAENRSHIVDLEFSHCIRKKIQHLRLNIDGQDLSFVSNELCQPAAEITCSSADIRDNLSGANSKGTHEQVGLFLLFAL